MAKLSIGWDVESDPEGTIWTAHEVGNSSRILGRAISTYAGWRLEVERDDETVDAGTVRGSWEDATSALADLLEREAGALVLCAGCGDEYPATSLEGGRCWPCARAA